MPEKRVSDLTLIGFAKGSIRPHTGRSAAAIAAQLEREAAERKPLVCQCGQEFTPARKGFTQCTQCYWDGVERRKQQSYRRKVRR